VRIQSKGMMMQGNVWLLIAIAVVLVIAVLWVVRSRYGRGALPPQPRDVPEPAPEVEGPPVIIGPAGAPADIPPPSVDDLVPAPVIAAPDGPPDDLSKLKGVGPKLITLLGTLGVTRYDQIAAWTEADIAAIDERLGAFKGRPARDKWVEQAGHLAAGDIAGFEAKFGKL